MRPARAGGVLLDSKGRLVGINTAILDPTGEGTSSGVGFAIPIDTVKGLVDQILTWVAAPPFMLPACFVPGGVLGSK